VPNSLVAGYNGSGLPGADVSPPPQPSQHRHGTAGLSAQGISAFRGERLVLRAVSFTVPPGGALLLLGANGSGKSTLLRVLAGLKRPDAGAVLWHGEAPDSWPVAYLGHQDAVKPGLTALENLAFAARTGRGAAREALAALDLLPLADLPARLLSAGQKRRLALARLVLSPVPIWLLDEPTLGLDAAAVARLGGTLAAHRAAGGIVVTATHLPLPLPDAAELHL